MDKNTVAKSINVTQQLIIMNAKFNQSFQYRIRKNPEIYLKASLPLYFKEQKL